MRFGEHEVEAFVFDLFHTLADPQEHSTPGFRRLAAVADILGIPELEIELWWEQVVGRLVSTPESPIDAVVELARSRRIVMSPAAVAEVDRAMGGAADAALATPISGAVNTLQALRDQAVRVGILSNALVRDVRSFPDSPLSDVIDDACMSCFTGLAKPDVAAYRLALERLGVEADRAVYVGDGGDDELAGAREAGFATVVAVSGPVERGGWRSDEEQSRLTAQADMVVGDVSELLRGSAD